MSYLHRRRPTLELFLVRPEIELHFNRSELLLRGPAYGRTAWLFTGSLKGAEAAAVWFSIAASWTPHGVDTIAYLRDVLSGIEPRTPTEVGELEPSRWAARQSRIKPWVG